MFIKVLFRIPPIEEHIRILLMFRLFCGALKPPAPYQPYVDSQVTIRGQQNASAMADSDSASEGASFTSLNDDFTNEAGFNRTIIVLLIEYHAIGYMTYP